MDVVILVLLTEFNSRKTFQCWFFCDVAKTITKKIKKNFLKLQKHSDKKNLQEHSTLKMITITPVISLIYWYEMVVQDGIHPSLVHNNWKHNLQFWMNAQFVTYLKHERDLQSVWYLKPQTSPIHITMNTLIKN